MNVHWRLLGTLACGLLVGSCGGPPAQKSAENTGSTPASTLDKGRPGRVDACELQIGQPPPEPLRTRYTGVAKAAGCQRAVLTIMADLKHFLGVECRHCHLLPDYAADTHNKQIANWMARELVPRLQKRTPGDGGGEVWCQDCHAGKPKLLGNPRRRDVAVEWMTTHLTEGFSTTSAKPPKCRDCHGGDLGSPEFRTKIILNDLPGLPAASAPSVPALATAPAAAAPAVVAPPTPSSTPVPDLGGR